MSGMNDDKGPNHSPGDYIVPPSHVRLVSVTSPLNAIRVNGALPLAPSALNGSLGIRA